MTTAVPDHPAAPCPEVSDECRDEVLEVTPPSQRPHITIRPAKGWASLRLHELWEFRDLLFSLGTRDVKIRYKQTALGVAWVVLQPLIGALIFTFVFGVLADMPSGKFPYFVLSFAGMLAWGLFSETLTGSSMVMVNNSHLVSKIYFPRLILPLSSAFAPVVNFVVTVALMAGLMIFYSIWPGWRLLLAPLWIVLLLMIALGLGFISSAIMVSYRDLRYIIPVATQFLLYASPVGYSLTAALDKKMPAGLETLYMLNPLASLLEAFRWSVLGEGAMHWPWLLYSAAASITLFVAGAFLFRRAERRFADVI